MDNSLSIIEATVQLRKIRSKLIRDFKKNINEALDDEFTSSIFVGEVIKDIHTINVINRKLTSLEFDLQDETEKEMEALTKALEKDK